MVRRIQASVPQPTPDDRDIDTGRDKLNTRGMSIGVRRNPLCREGWYVLGCSPNILSEFEANASRTQRPTVAVNEDRRVVGAGLTFPKGFE